MVDNLLNNRTPEFLFHIIRTATNARLLHGAKVFPFTSGTILLYNFYKKKCWPQTDAME